MARRKQAAGGVGLVQRLGLQHHHRIGERLACGRRQARDRADQHARVRVARPAQHVLGRALLDHAAVLHHDNAMRDLGDDAEIVRDEQDAGVAAFAQFLDEFQNLRLRGDVERGGRLVRDQQRGIEHQGGRDHDALALPARQLMRIDVDHALRLWQVHGTHYVEYALAAFTLVEPGVNVEHLGDLVADLHDRIERGHRLLEDHADPGAADLAHRGA